MSKEQRLAISYCRKSTKLKDKTVEESVGYQQQAIRQYAKRNGIEIVREFSDIGYSGKTLDRPELQEMVEYLKNTELKIDELIIYSIDRFGRDLQHNIQQMLEILQLVEKVNFVSQPISSDTTYFKLLFLTLTAVAQDERERLLARCSGGRNEKVISRKSFDGNYYPLGLVKKQDTETLVPAKLSNIVDTERNQELIQIQYIFYLYLFNFSLRKIAATLNERFGKTKREVDWTYKSVKYILENPIYNGKLRGVLEGSNHYLIEDANVEQIVDSATFMLVQKKLDFEKAGRKKNSTARNPFFNLCYSCSSYLIEKNGYLSCETCKELVDSTNIVEKIKLQMLNIINNHFNIEQYPTNDHISNLLERDTERLRAINIEIKKLQVRLEEIRGLDINQSIKDRMIKINTQEFISLNKTKAEIEVKLEFLNQPIKNGFQELLNKKVKKSLIRTPFIILYDFTNKEVVIVPHKNVLIQEGKCD
jgi:DNA invertase Pin-like site-specific DNA recombinase